MFSPKIGPNTAFTHIDRYKDAHGGLAGEHGNWRARWFCQKYDGDVLDPLWHFANVPAKELIVVDGNLLMYGGVSAMWECLIGNGTTTASQTLTYFNNGNAYVGVGTSAVAAVATQNDLLGAGVRAVM